MAGSDTFDPAKPCGPAKPCESAYPRFLQCSARPGARMTDDRIRYCRERPARELDEGILVVEEYAVRRRTAVLGKVRVLTS
jgi:hypothetical protein